jgi:hypothetical protein
MLGVCDNGVITAPIRLFGLYEALIGLLQIEPDEARFIARPPVYVAALEPTIVR